MQVTIQFNGSSTEEEMELGLKMLSEFKDLRTKLLRQKELGKHKTPAQIRMNPFKKGDMKDPKVPMKIVKGDGETS